jgi:dsRNA-specific ribonuclease
VIDGEETGVGRGSSKKAAEQNAAREALGRLSGGADDAEPASR